MKSSFLNLLIPINMLLIPAFCFAQPFYYVSPGFQVFYGTKNGLSLGAKVSVGVLTVASNSNNPEIVNITVGLLQGKRYERYAEIQYMAADYNHPFMAGGGFGISSRSGVSGVGARISFLSGILLFEDVTYNYFGQTDENGLEFGSSIVLPILFNPPSFNFY